MAPLTAELAEQTLKQTERRFDARVAPDGSPWVPRQRPEPHPLLEFEGKMRRSIGVRSLQETEAEIGTSGVSQIASVHQLGSTRARVPQRQFLDGWGKRDLRASWPRRPPSGFWRGRCCGDLIERA